MTDLEMTKLCAEAMELSSQMQGDYLRYQDSVFADIWLIYDPLHDDAQAMALAKRFGLVMDPQHDGQDFASDQGWEVTHPSLPEGYLAISPSLNRAIVECCAKMQFDRAEKKAPNSLNPS